MSTDPNGAGAPPAGTPPAGTPPPAAGAPATPTDFANVIPESFRDKPWAKENAKDAETFFKFVDNQNSLVGKKGVILPAENAPEAEWNAVYDALGRPKTADEYDMTSIPELKDAKRDVEADKSLKTLFYTTGVPKTMAAKLTQGFERMVFEKNKTILAKSAQEDKAFADYNTKLFGDKKESVVASAQKILRESVPAEAMPAFDKLDGQTLSLLVAITNNVYAKYGKEDAFKGGGAGAGTQETFEELSAQQRELMKNPGFLNFLHPEHNAVKEKNAALMAKMRLLKP